MRLEGEEEWLGAAKGYIRPVFSIILIHFTHPFTHPFPHHPCSPSYHAPLMQFYHTKTSYDTYKHVRGVVLVKHKVVAEQFEAFPLTRPCRKGNNTHAGGHERSAILKGNDEKTQKKHTRE